MQTMHMKLHNVFSCETPGAWAPEVLEVLQLMCKAAVAQTGTPHNEILQDTLARCGVATRRVNARAHFKRHNRYRSSRRSASPLLERASSAPAFPGFATALHVSFRALHHAPLFRRPSFPPCRLPYSSLSSPHFHHPH